MSRLRIASLLTLMVLVVAACGVAEAGERVDTPEGPEGTLSPRQAERTSPGDGQLPRTYHDMLLDVERLVSGFGGYFVEDGVMYVYMTEAIDPAVIEAAFAQVFDRDIVPTGGVRIVEGDYTFAQLYEWSLAIIQGIGLSNVTSFGISASRNRVTVGVGDEKYIEIVRGEIEQAAIVPIEAVHIHQSGPWFAYGAPFPHARIPDELPGYAVVDVLAPEDTPCLDRPQVWLRALDPGPDGNWAADFDDTVAALRQLESLLDVFHYVIVGPQLTDGQVIEGNQQRIEGEQEQGCRTIRFGGPLTLETEAQEETAPSPAFTPRPTPTPVVRPDTTPTPPENRVIENPYEGMTHEEMEAIYEQKIEKGLVERVPARGPETAGSVIDIAGQMVQLPDDAYIGGLWLAYTQRGPFWEIIRGDSTLVIHKVTGEIISQELAPGEEDAFDFVEEAMQGPSLGWGVGFSAALASLGGLGVALVRRRYP